MGRHGVAAGVVAQAHGRMPKSDPFISSLRVWPPTAMRLNAEHIEIIAYRVVHELAKNGLTAVDDMVDAEARMNAVITDDLLIEDRLNDEVRDIMSAYNDQIRRADVQFHEMFKVIKARLAHERNIII